MDLWWLSEPIERRPSWARRWPERLGWEIARLQERGRIIEVSKAAWAQGVLMLSYLWTHKGKEYPLWVQYPPGFPWTRPDVSLQGDRTLLPRRHCDPLTGRLCYLGHHRYAWGPQESIAAIIDEQLPKIIDTAHPVDEEAIGEPAENWWNVASKGNAMFVIDSSWVLGDLPRGTLRILYRIIDDPELALRCLCTKVTDADGAEVAKWDRVIPREFVGTSELCIPWVRLDAELFPRDQNAGLRTALAAAGNVPIVRLRGPLHARVWAVVFPTELTHGVMGDSWVMFMVTGTRRDLQDAREDRITYSTVRTMRAGVADLIGRAPDAAILRGRRVVLAGVGAIGAPIALDLARNGISELMLVDGDRVSPGNGIRWPFAESAWGQTKVDVLQDRIGADHAGVTVHRIPQQLGAIDLDAAQGSGADLLAFLQNADVVIDASTAFDALSILAERCHTAGVPLISVNATPTLEGGAIARYAPNSGCPTCLILHQQSTPATLPTPSGDQGDPHAVPLPGCAEATFAGSSFDLGELSLATMRVLVRTLRMPDPLSSVETLAFVGVERHPSWRTDRFEPHSQCGCRT